MAGGDQGTWRADGKELFYLAADDRMMSVTVDSSASGLKLGTEDIDLGAIRERIALMRTSPFRR
jgi:hypothetical protein